jgi:hypothetical protein
VDAVVEAELADRALVRAAALLHHRDRLPDLAARLEVAEQDHGVDEVARLDRRLHRAADEPGVRRHEQRRDAALAEVGEQLVELHGEEALLGHRVEVAVEAVDHDGCARLAPPPPSDRGDELAGRELGRIDRLDRHACRARTLAGAGCRDCPSARAASRRSRRR